MSKLKLFKGFALLNFIGLFAIFILYKIGSIDNLNFHHASNYFLSPNGGGCAINSSDTTKIKLDSILYKRLTLLRPPADLDKLFPKGITMNLNKDSVSINENPDQVRMKKMMSSSKSGVILESKPHTITQKRKIKKR